MFRPMLAVAANGAVKFPVLASPKLDGIRCLTTGDAAMSRSWKRIPNKWVQRQLSSPMFDGLDGELIVGDPNAADVYLKTNSAVMSIEGRPEFTFYVFDIFRLDSAFQSRYSALCEYVNKFHYSTPVKVLEHVLINNDFELLDYENECLLKGFEGVMLRDPNGLYKQGRSTLKEGGLLKVKRFTDSEAVVIGVEEFMHNGNEAELDERGYTKRSSAQANKIPAGMLGALRVKDWKTGIEFSIGTGFTKQQRAEFWNSSADLIGKFVKYKHFEIGVKEAPRFPVFIGFRNQIDM